MRSVLRFMSAPIRMRSTLCEQLLVLGAHLVAALGSPVIDYLVQVVQRPAGEDDVVDARDKCVLDAASRGGGRRKQSVRRVLNAGLDVWHLIRLDCPGEVGRVRVVQ